MPFKNNEAQREYRKANKERMAKYHKEYYSKNKQGYIDRKNAAKARNKAITDEIKSTTPCTDCGKKYHPFVMDFDHVGEKDRDVSLLVQAPASVKRLMAEIAKCELVCANCHRMRTFTRAGNSTVE